MIPPTALGACTPLAVDDARDIPAGTGIAVSPDGRWLAEYIHTSRGGEVKLHDRTASGDETKPATKAGAEPVHQIALEPPSLPTGIQWRIHEARFSPDSKLLVLRTTGAIYVIYAEQGQLLHTSGFDKEKQTYPGQIALGGGTLAVAYWLPESVFAQAAARKPVEVRLMEAASGKWLRSLLLALDSSDAWTKLALAPDASRLAVLLRPEFWPGKARLRVHDTLTGADEGELKIGAEDVDWSADGKELLVLGSRLVWLDAKTGKETRKAEGDIGASEFHKLRFSSEANLAAGHFTRFRKWRRFIRMNDQRDTMLTIWRLDTGKAVCTVVFPPTTTVYAWPTARGEFVALEETYEVRPQLRLLKSARVVTYRLAAR